MPAWLAAYIAAIAAGNMMRQMEEDERRERERREAREKEREEAEFKEVSEHLDEIIARGQTETRYRITNLDADDDDALPSVGSCGSLRQRLGDCFGKEYDLRSSKESTDDYLNRVLDDYHFKLHTDRYFLSDASKLIISDGRIDLHFDIIGEERTETERFKYLFWPRYTDHESISARMPTSVRTVELAFTGYTKGEPVPEDFSTTWHPDEVLFEGSVLAPPAPDPPPDSAPYRLCSDIATYLGDDSYDVVQDSYGTRIRRTAETRPDDSVTGQVAFCSESDEGTVRVFSFDPSIEPRIESYLDEKGVQYSYLGGEPGLYTLES